MENLNPEQLNPNMIGPDGLMDPNMLLQSMEGQKTNSIKEIKFNGDGLMERVTTKVVTNDGRELLF